MLPIVGFGPETDKHGYRWEPEYIQAQFCSSRCRARKSCGGNASIFINWRDYIGAYATLIPKLMFQGYLGYLEKITFQSFPNL